MKAIALIVSVLLMGQLGLADALKVEPRDYTCSDLQTLLVEEEKLDLVNGPSDWSISYYSQWQPCETNKTLAQAAYVRTSDKTFCRMGYVCAKRN